MKKEDKEDIRYLWIRDFCLVIQFEISIPFVRKVFIFDSLCKHQEQTEILVNHKITLSRNKKHY